MSPYALCLSLLFVTLAASAPAPADPAALYISHDRGASWVAFATGLPEDAHVRNLTEQAGTVYLITLEHGFFILPPDARVWVPSNEGLALNTETFFPTALAVHGEQIVIGTYWDGIHLSHDGGAHWQRAEVDIPGVIVSLLFTDDRWLAGTDTGLWTSRDGGLSWQQFGTDRTAINALAVHRGRLFVARQNGMGTVNGSEITWSTLRTEWAILQLLSQGDYLYTVGPRDEVFRSAEGNYWESPLLAVPGLPTDNLPEALWGGFEPRLPVDLIPGPVTATSRGWFVGPGGGC